MKRSILNILSIIIVLVLICCLLIVYFYRFMTEQESYIHDLFPTLIFIMLGAGCLAKLITSQGRVHLDVYEMCYKDEIGNAFKNNPLKRKKLLSACRFYHEKKYSKALKLLTQLFEESRQNNELVPILLFMALCYTELGSLDTAQKLYYKLLGLEPNHAQAHYNVGAVFMKIGDYDTALTHFDMAVEIQPNNYYAYLNRANYYLRIKDYDKSIADAKQALIIKDNGVEAAILLTVVYSIIDDEYEMENYYDIAVALGKKPDDLDEVIHRFSRY